MNIFLIHIQAIKETFQLLAKGKFLIYFIPGIVVTIFFGGISLILMNFKSGLADTSFEYLNLGINKTFDFFRFVFDQIYVFFILTLLSPFNSHLSEKLDEEITKNHFGYSFSQFITDFLRMLLFVSILVILELLCLAIYWSISKIVGLHFIDSLVYFIIASFFFGISFYDYSLERYQKNVGDSINYGFNNFLLILLTGSIFLLIYNIPFIGVFTAPVLMTMIATLVYLKHQKISIKND